MRSWFGVVSAAVLAQGAPSSSLPPGHPKVSSGKAPPSAADLLRDLDGQKDLKTREKTFEVAAALGKLYYANARYADAREYFHQALEKSEPVRALYLAQAAKAGVTGLKDGRVEALPGRLKALQTSRRAKLKNATALGCALTSDAEVNALVAKAKAQATAGKPAEAFTCAAEAVKPVAEAERFYAHALALTGDNAGALAAYSQALELDPADEESLYGYAGALWDAHPEEASTLKVAPALLELDLAANPQGLHAESAKRLLAHLHAVTAAGGFAAYREKHGAAAASAALAQGPAPSAPMAATGPDAPAPLSPAVVDAVKNTELTPEVVKGLDALVETAEDQLAHQKFQDALDAYKRVVPFRPNDGRARAGMAWSLVGLNRQPMADRIWGVAVSSDAAAVDQLGDRLAQKGDARGAVELWKKLRLSAPEYAASTGLEKKLH